MRETLAEKGDSKRLTVSLHMSTTNTHKQFGRRQTHAKSSSEKQHASYTPLSAFITTTSGKLKCSALKDMQPE